MNIPRSWEDLKGPKILQDSIIIKSMRRNPSSLLIIVYLMFYLINNKNRKILKFIEASLET